MNDTTRQIGGAIGVAVLGSIVASSYRSHMSSALDGKVRAGVVHAASDSVGAALGAARDLGGSAAREVVAAAQASFVSGMHVAVIVGASIIALGAMGVLRWLPARVVDEYSSGHVVAADAPSADAPSASAEPSGSGDELPTRVEVEHG